MAFVATRACPDIPTVVTFHGSDLVGEKLSPIRRLSAAMGVVASNQAARRADGIVAVWSYLRDILPADIDRSKVRIIPNGIDLERFAPSDPLACRQALGWTGDAVHVLFVTNGSPQKRPELARKAVERLRERGVAAELHELQGVPYDRIPRWINASDVLLVTSEHEASPTIVKECLACNVPVVSVDVGDVRERIEGIDGCLIADADANELAAGMHAVCSAFPRVDGRTHMQSLSFMSTSSRLYDFYCDVVEAHQSVPVHGMRSS
jgi:glycosyltransferase involved in cell wall biosynthesis